MKWIYLVLLALTVSIAFAVNLTSNETPENRTTVNTTTQNSTNETEDNLSVEIGPMQNDKRNNQETETSGVETTEEQEIDRQAPPEDRPPADREDNHPGAQEINVMIRDGKNICQRSNKLRLDVDGLFEDAKLHYIGPFEYRTEVIGYRNGNDLHTQMIPGTTTVEFEVWSEVNSPEAQMLFEWRKSAEEGVDRRDGSVIVTQKPQTDYDFYQAWPSFMEGPAEDPCTGKLVDKYTITLERLERGGSE